MRSVDSEAFVAFDEFDEPVFENLEFVAREEIHHGHYWLCFVCLVVGHLVGNLQIFLGPKPSTATDIFSRATLN